MPQEEKYGTRDRSYSAWHRRLSTRRFVGIENAQLLSMIDLDAALYLEYDDATKEPLALIETAVDRDQQYKPAAVTTNLARKADIPAFTVLYTLSPTQRNPADDRWPDISFFRVRRTYPDPTKFVWLTPEDWAKALLRIRQKEARRLDELWATTTNGSHATKAAQ